jgi:hypothetical protein
MTSDPEAPIPISNDILFTPPIPSNVKYRSIHEHSGEDATSCVQLPFVLVVALAVMIVP